MDGTPKELSTKREWDPLKWNSKAGRAEGKTEAAKSVNEDLDVLHKKVYEIRKWLVDNDYPVSSENIKTKLQGREIKIKGYMLMEIFQKHNEEMEALVGKDYAPGSQRKCNHNTAMKYLSNFKKIVLYCVNCGWLARNPFAAFKMHLDDVDIEPLSENELEVITELTCPTDRLSLVRDIFLFSCYSGLAFAHVKKLKYTDIRIGNDGQDWIHSKRQKSKVPAKIPLLHPKPSSLKDYNRLAAKILALC